jgi:hypothetical protein
VLSGLKQVPSKEVIQLGMCVWKTRYKAALHGRARSLHPLTLIHQSLDRLTTFNTWFLPLTQHHTVINMKFFAIVLPVLAAGAAAQSSYVLLAIPLS